VENTANWVDEKYAALLSKQHRDNISNLTTGSFLNHNTVCKTIREIRKTPNFLCEISYDETGFGVNKKTVTGVFFLAHSPLDDSISIYLVYYNSKGKLLTYNTGKVRWSQGKGVAILQTIVLSKHAHIRLFERLRTNSKEDVVRILSELAGIDPPYANGKITKEGTVHLKGVGRFELGLYEGTTAAGHKGLCWVVKTFIAEKK
jgi:hypothetical protein